ncbi:MAG: hypothetical protein ABSC50_03125 [Candidatus Bathyarchaeia archaeon]
MSVSIGSIVMTVKAIDEASGVMGKISASMGLIGMELQTLGPGFSQLGQVIQGFAVGGPTGAAIVGIGEVVKGLQDSVVAAGNMQTAWVGIQSVLHLTGAAWDAVSVQLQAGIDKIRESTTQSDLDLTNSMQVLLTYGMNTTQAIAALNAAVDIAAAKHIDLSTAATALGKAFQGNDMLLVRYGIDVATVAKQTTLGAEAIKELAVNLESGTAPQLQAFDDAMSAAGLAVADASGKMMTHAAIMKEIEAAWKAGSISGDQLSTIVAALGINFQGSKALAMDYANVLSQVNDQYGGTAQAQATTYAGLQERLANAVQTLGEKIGAILLPALTSLLEALLPIVDGFTKAIPAVEGFFAAIGKLPEIQGTVSAFQGIWDGLVKSFNDAWDSVKGDLMPALQSLQDAFNQLMAALQPLFDAFNELWKAITGSGSDFNLFQAILEAIVLAIKGLVVVIQVITPIIHLFAQAFKDAADFIVPILEAIRNALGAFFKWITDGFQAFYDWLVGRSLWQDLWNAVLSVTTQAITGILNALTGGFFGKLQDAFTQAVTAVHDSWSSGMKGVEDTLTKTIADVQAQSPLLASALQVGLDILQGNWGAAFDNLGKIANTEFDAITSTISSFINTAKAALATAWSDMQNDAASAMSTLGNLVQGAMTAIANAANNLWNALTHHSIWPDMMAEMVAQTHAGMVALQGEFAQGFSGPTGILSAMQTGGAAFAGAAPTATGSPAAPSSQAITLPISVYLDGQQIQTFLEKRLVQTLYRDASRGKRGTV